jgi:4-amino-4-deoxy-L-arabinose transferase-like glycosyltransferase
MPHRTLATRNLILIVLIIVGAAVVYLLGNGSVSLWDRDEPRYAQTSRQMLDSKDWVVPMLLDERREKKPVFIYWCQATSMAIFGEDSFGARFPSSVFVAATLIMLAGVFWRTIGPQRALWSTLIFGTSGLTIAAAKMCITDGVLILFITGAQLCLYAILRKRANWPVVIPCGIAVGFGLLTKGPVVLGVMLTTAIVWWVLGLFRSTPEKSQPATADPARIILKWIVAIALAVAIYGLWGFRIERRIPNYHIRTIKAEVIDRATTPQEGHTGPPGYYLLTIWGTLFPWSLFEAVATKLPHYVLPTFPAIAFLTADMLIRTARQSQRWRAAKSQAGDSKPRPLADRLFLGAVLFWGGAAILISLLPWIATIEFGAPNRIALAAMIILPILAIEYTRSTFIHFRAARPLDAAAIMGIGMLILIGISYSLYLPNAPYLQISQQVAQILRREGATYHGAAIMIDYKETSLPFYQGGTVRPEKDDRFLEHIPQMEWPRWIVLTGEIWNSTPDQIRDQFETIKVVHGLNYADKMRILDVMVIRKK